MEWLFFALLGVVIIIFIVAAIKGSQRRNQLLAEGKIVQRPNYFWEYRQIVGTSATCETVWNAVDRTDFSAAGVSIQKNLDGEPLILFQHKGAWNAVIKFDGEKDGRYQFEIFFSAWENIRGNLPYAAPEMNIFLTTAEKMFLSLDPSTTVESHRMQLNSKVH